MQRLDPDKILQMKGTEYQLLHSEEPHLFVIRKVQRDGPSTVYLLAIYYVINGTIYQAPSLYSVFSTRMVGI
jgi:mediator of RNA polymerase II transcription subunit 6